MYVFSMKNIPLIQFAETTFLLRMRSARSAKKTGRGSPWQTLKRTRLGMVWFFQRQSNSSAAPSNTA